MLFLKSSFIFIFSLSLLAFDGNECFSSNYNVEVKHKAFPFGLLSKTLEMKKEKCSIEISFNRYKYLNSKWEIDICRNPVHIKETSRTTNVIRKVNECTNVKNKFCNEYLNIKKVIEDNGLIFAKGDKSELDSSHGKVYCTYLLINRYLDKNLVFNSGNDYGFIANSISVSEREDDFVVNEDAGMADF